MNMCLVSTPIYESAEGNPPGEHFVHDDAERVDVGAMVDFSARRLPLGLM
jgi:hypothetical protein